jgi:SAM-dependent methyltransferase
MTVLPGLDALLRQDLPPAVVLMRLMLSGLAAEDLLRGLAVAAGRGDARLDALLHLAHEAQQGLRTLERMVAAGADHGPAASATEGVDAARRMFDRLVALSPEASVAAYSLGDPARLAAATAEVVEWLQGLGLLDGRPSVLDLGCGVGRFCVALAPFARRLVGLEVSEGMARVARQRLAGIDHAAVLRGSGHDLAPLRDGAFDLVLAADVFPYIVQASPELADRHLMETRRVLRPDGSLVILNWAYGSAADHPDELERRAASAGLLLHRSEEIAFRQWDGSAFWLKAHES